MGEFNPVEYTPKTSEETLLKAIATTDVSILSNVTPTKVVEVLLKYIAEHQVSGGDVSAVLTSAKAYTDAKINALELMSVKVVSELPATGDKNFIYFVPDPDTAEVNHYLEYMYIEKRWELIGTTKVDLTDYAKTSEVTQALIPKANQADVYTKTESDAKYQPLVSYVSQAEYDGLTDTQKQSGTYFITSEL